MFFLVVWFSWDIVSKNLWKKFRNLLEVKGRENANPSQNETKLESFRD